MVACLTRGLTLRGAGSMPVASNPAATRLSTSRPRPAPASSTRAAARHSRLSAAGCAGWASSRRCNTRSTPAARGAPGA